jgi:nitrite reductase/ring-hydroxylating ferredoxin subunit/uncharacterized membrane protein
MRSTAHIKGHPIHPMLVAFPAAYLFGSAVIDAIAGITRRREWFRTARHMNALGIGTALAAAIPGAIDYLFSVPPRSSGRTRATDHMIANVSALALFSAARLGHGSDGERPSPWAVAAELCGAGLVVTAGWLGGTLVYRNQIGVDHRYANAGKWRAATIPAGERAIDAAAVDALAVNQLALIHAGGERIVVGRTETGTAAFQDRCTHKGGPLSDGTMACGVVQCPWHGSQFDVHSGEVKQGPAEQAIETYEVKPSNGRLAIDKRRTSSGS